MDELLAVKCLIELKDGFRIFERKRCIDEPYHQ
jgi:hypothetical protein